MKNIKIKDQNKLQQTIKDLNNLQKFKKPLTDLHQNFINSWPFGTDQNEFYLIDEPEYFTASEAEHFEQELKDNIKDLAPVLDVYIYKIAKILEALEDQNKDTLKTFIS